MSDKAEAPSIHFQWLPDRTPLESFGFSPETRRLYKMMGHRVYTRGGKGSATGIFID